LEYVLRRGERGQTFVYELIYDGGGQDGRRFLPGLFDVEKLRRAGNDGAQEGSGTLPPAPTTADLPGETTGFPGGFRPVSGPVPGGFRPAENTDSSSEKSPGDVPSPENTPPGPEKNAAAA
ncbi:MAG: hypothetical protein ACREIA_13750, partial [Opitutaceae bacterium]